MKRPRIVTRILLVSIVALILKPAPVPGAAEGDGEAALPLVNDRCPVMSDEFTSPTQEITFHGVAVRFCCGMCKRRFEDDPAAFVARLPQLSPDVIATVMVESQNAQRTARAEAVVERWTRPLLLTVAGLLTAWLLVRLYRRRPAANASA